MCQKNSKVACGYCKKMFVQEDIVYDFTFSDGSGDELHPCNGCASKIVKENSKRAVVLIPEALLGEQEDGSVVLQEMVDMNGIEILVQDSNHYCGSIGVDWDKYDYFTPSDDFTDGLSWKKEWLEFK